MTDRTQVGGAARALQLSEARVRAREAKARRAQAAMVPPEALPSPAASEAREPREPHDEFEC